jgi:hypothetical protein
LKWIATKEGLRLFTGFMSFSTDSDVVVLWTLSKGRNVAKRSFVLKWQRLKCFRIFVWRPNNISLKYTSNRQVCRSQNTKMRMSVVFIWACRAHVVLICVTCCARNPSRMRPALSLTFQQTAASSSCVRVVSVIYLPQSYLLGRQSPCRNDSDSSVYCAVCCMRWVSWVLEGLVAKYEVLTQCLCVLCGSQNKQRLFHCTELTDWFV